MQVTLVRILRIVSSALHVVAIIVGFTACLLTPFANAQAPKHGYVQNGRYIDPRFGLSYTFPSGLKAQSSLNGMPVGTGEKQGTSEFLFDAMEDPNGRVRSGVFITTDPIGVFGTRDVREYLKNMAELVMGFSGPIEFQQFTIASRTFYRSDVGVGSAVHSYGAQVGTTCNSHFLTFFFSGASPEIVDRLVRSLDSLELRCPNNR